MGFIAFSVVDVATSGFRILGSGDAAGTLQGYLPFLESKRDGSKL